MAWEAPQNPNIAGLANPLPLPRNDSEIDHSYLLYSLAHIPPPLTVAAIQPVESSEERATNDGRQEIVWSVPYSLRLLFRQWVLGYANTVIAADGPAIRRTIPLQHPELLNYFATHCDQVKAGAVGLTVGLPARAVGEAGILNGPDGNPASVPGLAYGDNDSVHRDGKCFYRVIYEPLPYAIHTDEEMPQVNAALKAIGNVGITPVCELGRFVSYQGTYSVQAVSVPLKLRNPDGSIALLQFARAQQVPKPPGQPAPPADTPIPSQYDYVPVPEALALQIIPQRQITITLHHICDVPDDTINGLIGTVNLNAFGGCQGMPLFPAQTMLLQAASFEQMTGDNMRPMFDLKLTYAQRTATDYTQKPPVQGWNCFLTATGQFRLAQFYQNGNVSAAVAALSQVAAAATNVQNVVATANADAQAIGKALQANPAIPVDPILVANLSADTAAVVTANASLKTSINTAIAAAATAPTILALPTTTTKSAQNCANAADQFVSAANSVVAIINSGLVPPQDDVALIGINAANDLANFHVAASAIITNQQFALVAASPAATVATAAATPNMYAFQPADHLQLFNPSQPKKYT